MNGYYESAKEENICYNRVIAPPPHHTHYSSIKNNHRSRVLWGPLRGHR